MCVEITEHISAIESSGDDFEVEIKRLLDPLRRMLGLLQERDARQRADILTDPALRDRTYTILEKVAPSLISALKKKGEGSRTNTPFSSNDIKEA